VLDRERILAKLDALHGYERELSAVLPGNLNDYTTSIEKKRATERLLQVSVESILDVCGLFVAGLRLGLPAEEENLFDRLEQAGVFSPDLIRILRAMRRFRNILVHEYGAVDDKIVFQLAGGLSGDVRLFTVEVTRALSARST
jgi:uncharacterized protein YutE (UPF0331/DUF86 family)